MNRHCPESDAGLAPEATPEATGLGGVGNVLAFRPREASPPVFEVDVSSLLFDAIGDIRIRAFENAQTHAGRNALIQALLLVARGQLKEQTESAGALMTRSGMHRRNAYLRVQQLLELASELAALDVIPSGV